MAGSGVDRSWAASSTSTRRQPETAGQAPWPRSGTRQGLRLGTGGTALRRATRSARSASTAPTRSFGIPVARPAWAARAAASGRTCPAGAVPCDPAGRPRPARPRPPADAAPDRPRRPRCPRSRPCPARRASAATPAAAHSRPGWSGTADAPAAARSRRAPHGSVGVLVRVHPTGHHRGSRSGRSSIERRMCHRGHVRPGRLTRVGRHAPAGQSGQDSDGYLRAQAPMRSHRRLVGAHEPRSRPNDRSRQGPEVSPKEGQDDPLRGSPTSSLSEGH